MIYTDKDLDYQHEHAMRLAQKTLRQLGMMFSVVNAYSRNRSQFLIVETDEDSPTITPDGFLLLPGPLGGQTGIISRVFKDAGIIAATLSGEAWAYPRGKEKEYHQAYMDGRGPAPSEHPERTELVFTATVYPAGGYYRSTSFFMLREGVGEQTPVVEFIEDQDLRITKESEGDSGTVESWLIDLLPKKE